MSEPLFLQSVMQEKIWGGTKLRDEFGYDIPSEKIGEYWAISAHPNGVSKVANGRYEGTDLATLYAEHRELFGNRPEPVFPRAEIGRASCKNCLVFSFFTFLVFEDKFFPSKDEGKF